MMKRIPSKRQRWADHYTVQAQKEHYPARSVYKLKQAQKKFRIIRKGDQVLDLGCSPGSWLLYAAELTGKRGKVFGIDLKPAAIKMPPQVETFEADILTIDRVWLENKGLAGRSNVVLSDMAPATTGHKMIDAERSYQLCRAALHIARMSLRSGGSFFCKIFQGEEFMKFSDSVRNRFKNHKIFKPQSSRKESKEIYIIGMGFRR